MSAKHIKILVPKGYSLDYRRSKGGKIILTKTEKLFKEQTAEFAEYAAFRALINRAISQVTKKEL